MNSKKIIVCVLLGVILFAHAINHEETFLQANKLYKQEQYAKALDLYTTMPNKGSVVWYNMGNSAYRLNEYYDAVLFWRRAEQGASYAQMHNIAHNIKQLEQHIPDFKTLQPMALPFNKIKQRLWPFSLLALQVMMLIMWGALMALLGLCIRGRRFVLLAVLVVINGLMAGVLYEKYCVESVRIGIVMQTTEIFTGPHKQYHEIGLLARGASVEIKEQRDNWYKVRRDHLVGWVFADTLSEV